MSKTAGQKLEESVDFLATNLSINTGGDVNGQRRVAVVLGSGLGDFANQIQGSIVPGRDKIEYQDIPHFPRVKADGHAGVLHYGLMGHTEVLCLQGRAHFNEGWTMEQVVHPIRTLMLLGAQVVIATNAAGILNRNFNEGSLVLIRSHGNFLWDGPIFGPDVIYKGKHLGPHFLDMNSAYTPELLNFVQDCASKLGQQLPKGVYAPMRGRCFETEAEARMLLQAGMDLAGMSTVPEIIAAHHMGRRTIAISAATNYVASITLVTHEYVQDMAKRAAAQFVPLLTEIITNMPF